MKGSEESKNASFLLMHRNRNLKPTSLQLLVRAGPYLSETTMERRRTHLRRPYPAPILLRIAGFAFCPG